MQRALALVVVAGTLAGCGDARTQPAATGEAPSGAATTARESDGGALDALTIELVAKTNAIPSGGNLHTELVVSNDSASDVVDPSCWLAAGRFGLVPEDDPGAPLWGAAIVDCAGAHRMEPGYRDRFSGPDFPATTATGDPLPPGDYLAALDLQGRSERLFTPIEIAPAE